MAISKFVSKQELKSVPLQLIHEKTTLAISNVEYNLVELEKRNWQRMIARKEKEWTDTHEAPFEGSFSEEYPFVEPDPIIIQDAKKKAKAEALKEVIESLGLKSKAAWFLPQLVAYISKMKLIKNAEGKIDPKLFRIENFGKDDWHKGLYALAMVGQRGLIVPSQTNAEFKNYSALVPLLMMPFKKFDKIPYKSWDTDGLHQIVDANLYEAMTYDKKPELSNEDILAIRDKGLEICTGQKMGTMRNPATYHQLYKLQGTPLEDMPWLCNVMYTQIWSAHPANRTDLMILDWLDWDKMPEPLIEHKITHSIPTRKPTTEELDW